MSRRILAFLCVLVLGEACGGGDDRAGGAESQPIKIDGCMRAYDDLMAFSEKPRACADGCPLGSHCDESKDTCAFDCMNNSDCGHGNQCDCSGTCKVSLAPTPPPNGTAGSGADDPTCPRSADLLAAISADPVHTTHTGCAPTDTTCLYQCSTDVDCPTWSHCQADTQRCAPRSCSFDDQCPYGSHCDGGSGRCTFECEPGVANLSCPTGETCDCYGRCASPTDPVVQATASFSFDLSTTQLSPDDLKAPATVTVTVHTASATLAGTPSLQPVVRIQGESGVLLNGSTSPLVLQTWTFTQAGTDYAATATFTVGKGVGFDPDQLYTITARSSGTQDMTQRLLVGPPGAQDGPPAVPDGMYTLSGTYNITYDGTKYTETLTAARATVHNNKLFSQQMSDNWSPNDSVGRFIGDVERRYTVALVVGATGTIEWTLGAPLQMQVTAAPSASATPGTYTGGETHFSGGSNGHSVDAVFDFTLVARNVPVTACQSDTDCTAFQRCDAPIGACITMADSVDPGRDNGNMSYQTPATPAEAKYFAGEDFLCANASAAAGTGHVDYTSRPLPVSGDLICTDGKPMRTAELLYRRDTGSSTMGGRDAANQCLANLTNPSVWNESCINPSRFGHQNDAYLEALVEEQWLQVHSFIAAQLRTDDTLGDILQDGTDQVAQGPDVVMPVLDRGLAKGLMFSHDLDSPSSLRFGDYRHLTASDYWTFNGQQAGSSITRDIIADHSFTMPTGVVAGTDRVLGTGGLTASVTLGHLGALAWNGGIPSVSGKSPVWTLTGKMTIGLDVSPGSDTMGIYVQAGTKVASVNGTVPSSATSFFLIWRPTAVPSGFEVFADGKSYGMLAITGLDNSLANPTNVTFNVYGWAADAALWDRAPDDREVRFSLDRFHEGKSLPLMSDDDQATSPAVALTEYAAEYLRYAEYAMDQDRREFFEDCTTKSNSSSQQAAMDRFHQAILHAIAASRTAAWTYARAHQISCQTDSDCSAVGGSCLAHDPLNVSVKECTLNPVPGRAIEQTPVDYGPVSWDQRFINAQNDLQTEIQNAQRQYQAALQCRNPLGIEKWDLPLYFSDTSGINTSFFAASDYLLERVAAPALADASGRIASARTAWLNARNSQIQQLQNDQERERRLENIATTAGAQVIDQCGLYDVPALDILRRFDLPASDPNYLSANSCWKVPGTTESFRGTVGQHAHAIFSAAREVFNAHSRSADAMEQYSDKDMFCTELENDNKVIEQEKVEHDQRVKGLHDTEKHVGLLSGIIGGAISDVSAVLTGGAAGGGGGEDSSLFGIAVHLERNHLDGCLELENNNYEESLQKRTLKKEENACWAEAKALRFPIREAARNAMTAVENAAEARVQLLDAIGEIRAGVATARAQLAREQRRTVPSVAHHYWVNEELDQYQRSFVRAQRYIYLAMLAVEYEFQESLGLRKQILTAKKPADLENVAAIIRAEIAARTVNGRRPEQTTVVLSLRKDILKLDDAPQAPGERGWDSVQRFGTRLMSRDYAVYDNNGKYLGQGIPFTLGPVGALQYRCAERVSRINATLQVDALGVVEPSVPIIMRKKNTFASQYCEGHGDPGEPEQVVSMRPSAQLISGGGKDTPTETTAFTSSLISAWLNVPRSDFYKDDYRNGASSEFAGRGLYGEYVLLFPESGLLEMTDPARADFPLSKVEDVLLRFDLVSVDNLQAQ